jgi:hypothetical protein
MTDVALTAAIIIALEALRWLAGPTVAYAVAAIAFAFCVGALWGAGDTKRRLHAMQDQIEGPKP